MIRPDERLRIYDRMVMEGEDPDHPLFDLKLFTQIVDECKRTEGVDDCFACPHFDRCGLRKKLQELRDAAKKAQENKEV